MKQPTIHLYVDEIKLIMFIQNKSMKESELKTVNSIMIWYIKKCSNENKKILNKKNHYSQRIVQFDRKDWGKRGYFFN